MKKIVKKKAAPRAAKNSPARRSSGLKKIAKSISRTRKLVEKETIGTWTAALKPKEIDAAIADAAMKAHEILTGVKTTSAQNVLELAAYGIVSQGNLRDQPNGERSMRRTVQAFNALTGNALTERDGWLFMATLKSARSVYGAHNADDYQDGAAYFALAGECAARVEMEKELARSSTFTKGVAAAKKKEAPRES